MSKQLYLPLMLLSQAQAQVIFQHTDLKTASNFSCFWVVFFVCLDCVFKYTNSLIQVFISIAIFLQVCLFGREFEKGDKLGSGMGNPSSTWNTGQAAGSLTTQEKGYVPAMGHSLASISVLNTGESCILLKTSSSPSAVKT